jgi:mRNA-degrading endonuclease RelE of RelBE toxin-antitoxin system
MTGRSLSMQTVVEVQEFIRRADHLLSPDERELLINYLARFPFAGALIQGACGVRKLRWTRDGIGKRGGSRVIYYIHSENMPLYLLTVFGKNEKADLTMAERIALGKIAKRLGGAQR